MGQGPQPDNTSKTAERRGSIIIRRAIWGSDARREEAGIVSDYEKHKYVLQSGFYYSSEMYEPHKTHGYVTTTTKIRDITYPPDFVDPHGRWVIEVKGYANDVFPIKWKMFKNHLMQLEEPPVLFLPKNQKQVLQTIELIQEKF